MHIIDLLIFVFYVVAMLGVGFYFFRKNEGAEDYYVGGRNIGSLHIGLSVVATDVGGGFSIGLGGLGFVSGISGSWMLFTGLIGAYASAMFLIPRVKGISELNKFTTFPEVLGHFFNHRVAFAAAVISAVGYLGFTSSQMLAGAKLAAATFPDLGLQGALWIMGGLIVMYTMLGGLKAVIFTDTIQWIILMGGLLFIGLPVSYFALGGWEGISAAVPPEFFSLTNISWHEIVNWCIIIIPIWFVGMTLYQRIFASRSEKEAKRAWMIAAWFEWPLMAFLGVLLGLFARVAAEQGLFEYLGYASAVGLDKEMGLPFLLRTVLPVGLMGVMMAAYFSAIMSTADSCLMAASGNIVTDLLGRLISLPKESARALRYSQIATFVIGAFALLLASFLDDVLELMLYSYAFMVSGLFVPVIAALFVKRRSNTAALSSMIAGGSVTLILSILEIEMPYQLSPNLFGLATAFGLYFLILFISPDKTLNTTT